MPTLGRLALPRTLTRRLMVGRKFECSRRLRFSLFQSRMRRLRAATFTTNAWLCRFARVTDRFLSSGIAVGRNGRSGSWRLMAVMGFLDMRSCWPHITGAAFFRDEEED